jgi:hypothetical protein
MGEQLMRLMTCSLDAVSGGGGGKVFTKLVFVSFLPPRVLATKICP